MHYDKCLTSIHKYAKMMSKSWKKVKKSVIICNSCWCTYSLLDSIEFCNNEVRDKEKSNICGNVLRQNGKPLNSLTYVSLLDSIKTVLCKERMIESCINSLKKIVSRDDVIAEDVLQGSVFKRLFYE